MKSAVKFAICFGLLTTLCVSVLGQDPGWPRKLSQSTGTVLIYQPQIDEWKDYSTLTWRQAFELTPTGGKAVMGAATIKGNTIVDNDKRTVLVQDIQVSRTYFPSLDPSKSSQMEQVFKTLIPPTVNISLDRVIAYLPKPDKVPDVPLKNDPPKIFISYVPAILLAVDDKPVLADIPKTNLKFVVNTQWPVFLDTSKSMYYVLVDHRWFTGADLNGPWTVATTLPKDMKKLPEDQQWASLKAVIPPPTNATGPVPKIFYSTVPSEMILFDGKPVYEKIPQTQLVYATNTSGAFFVYTPTNEYYYLAAGRWFRTKNLQGDWTFTSLDLPADFAKIPRSSPASAVLSSVPGTDEAKDAVLLAQVPTRMEIDPKTAAEKAKVTYSGDPKFAPIEGTSLSYATNTADKVIKVGDVYYLCLQGVWFNSPNPEGPWTTATSVPPEIYKIPPSSPVYNVTYVTQTVAPSGYVESSYTAGYMGVFIMGATVGAICAWGSGYYYPPYIYYPRYGYPYYRGYPVAYGAGGYYNHWNGSYGGYRTVSGPYGSATRGASYNPYTGTYKRGASVSTPYGSRSAGQAYNPYTGTYAASRQGSSPSGQWGQSYASNGNKSAVTQHYSNARGTVGSVQGSQGGKAVGASGAYGSGAVAKGANGDVYAGRDGNVYKNTNSGWQKYDNGGWNSVDKSQAQAQAQQRASTYQQQRTSSGTAQERQSMSTSSLNSEMQNRQRGSAQAQNFQRSGGGQAGGGRAARSGGRRR